LAFLAFLPFLRVERVPRFFMRNFFFAPPVTGVAAGVTAAGANPGVAAGVGAKVEGLAVAAVDNRFSPPVQLTGIVEAIHHGDVDAETEVVIRVGSIHVIITKKRKPYHNESDFTNLGLKPREADIVVVKIGYLVPELYDIRGGWIMAQTPGGVDQDLERLGHKRIMRPMYPLDKDMADPDLKARFLKSSD
jgi:microcystin degradation protein MlrC